MKKIALVLPVLLVLGLILAGCAVPNSPVGAPKAHAAARDVAGTGLELGQTFTLQYDGGAYVNINGVDQYVVRFNLVDDQGNIAATAYCANMDVHCQAGDKYQLVSATDYFKNGEDLKLKAALTYIENNYGYLKDSNQNGYNQLLQAVTWNIINHYPVTGISNDPDGTLYNAATYIIKNLDSLVNDYSISTNVTMEGTGSANGNLYGPFNVSENAILADVAFDLTFDQSAGSAKFVDGKGTEITQVKPGEEFYVQVADGVSGDFKFTATASLTKQYYYMNDFLLFLNVDDVKSGQVNHQPVYQPVFQPLFQPLFTPEMQTYNYTCSGNFSIVPTGGISIEKTVGGINIATWASAKGKDIGSLISFDLKDAAGNVVASAVTPDAKGMINFAGLADGTYTVVENLTAAGKLVFEQVDPMTVTITGGKQDNGSDFNPNAKYMGLKGNDGDAINAVNKTDNTGTNPYTIYNFKVQNEATNSEYLSFCGNYGSSGLDTVQANLWKLDPALQADITGMLNYIFAKYGSIDKWAAAPYDPNTGLQAAVDDPVKNTKLIAQIAIWLTLGEGLQSVNLTGCPNLTAAIQDVVANGKTTLGNISIFFLAGVDYPADINGIQPQLVPVYAGVFNNTEKQLPPPPPALGPSQSSVTATNAGNVPAILAGLNPKNGNPVYDAKKPAGNTPFVVPNSNHFVYAVLDVKGPGYIKDGVWNLQFVVGNKYDIVGTGFVKPSADGKSLVITINGKGSFGALAFTSVPTPNNGNIQSLTKPADTKAFGASAGFSFNSQATISCPAGNPIYLYIDCDSFQFYK